MIYADYAATTPVKPQVLTAMLPYFSEEFGNPSSVHRAGRHAKRALETAREQCAAAIGANVRELFFTSGGTEADNLALFGCANQLRAAGKTHLLISPIEHHAVLHAAEVLAKQGFAVEALPVDGCGIVHPDALQKRLRPDTGLVSVHAANNEIGTIEPIAALSDICRARGVLFHTDAVQAFGHLPIDLRELPVDLLAVSGHKIGAPKGSGFLYVREGLRLDPQIVGGGQERRLRSGTENLPALVGLGVAAELAVAQMDEKNAQIRALRDELLARIQKNLPQAVVNGSLTHRLSGNLSLSIPGVQGESLLLLLDLQGICASAGSACTTGHTEASHVLRAIGQSEALAQGAIRFSLSEQNTPEEIAVIAQVLTEQVHTLWQMSGYHPKEASR